MSTTEYALVFPARCDRGRPWLLLVGIGAMVVGSSLLWAPSLFMDNPIIRLLERVTHLPHVPVPTTPEEQRPITAYGILIFAMGSVYFLESSLFWNTGGRLSGAALITFVCFFTNQGSSMLFIIVVIDMTFALLTRLATGSRKELAPQIITVSDLKASKPAVVVESTSLLRSNETEINV
ncbi:hypothetical protein Clacol_004542 [Clathrus columnatus]|uniref:Uncharacterized protein n=1 Tax=Clathrus columnatus TaxID=1419009 RepID=A0AAV5ABB3_9AGAM|nr:hypothetical protein Clacol_004542 [Clathrus columnatus]